MFFKDLFFLFLMATQGNYVLDSNILAAPDKSLKLDHYKEYHFPWLVNNNNAQAEVFLQYSPPKNRERAEKSLQDFLRGCGSDIASLKEMADSPGPLCIMAVCQNDGQNKERQWQYKRLENGAVTSELNLNKLYFNSHYVKNLEELNRLKKVDPKAKGLIEIVKYLEIERKLTIEIQALERKIREQEKRVFSFGSPSGLNNQLEKKQQELSSTIKHLHEVKLIYEANREPFSEEALSSEINKRMEKNEKRLELAKEIKNTLNLLVDKDNLSTDLKDRIVKYNFDLPDNANIVQALFILSQHKLLTEDAISRLIMETKDPINHPRLLRESNSLAIKIIDADPLVAKVKFFPRKP